jgi:choline monooxygenase
MLGEECGRSNVIRCPYHSWGYGLDGKLLGAPYFADDEPLAEAAASVVGEMNSFCKEDFGLLPVRVETWGCFVFVNLDSSARPLSAWLGDLPTRLGNYPLNELQLHRRKIFKVNANWKLIAENFMEYYHLPWVHPELNTVSTLDNHQRWQGPGMYTGMCTHPLAPADLPIDPGVLPNIPGINEHDAKTAYWVLIVPNIALFLLPHHLFTLILNPDGVGRTIEYADLLVHPATLEAPGAEASLDAIFRFWDLVNQQDIAAVERVQRGIQAKQYHGGRMCFKFEESIHRFQNMIIDLMTGLERTPAGDEGT